MKHKQPWVIVPNHNMGDHLCSIFNLPKRCIIVGNEINLRGFGSDSAFIVYTEGWDGNMHKYVMILEALQISNATVIFCPEIMPVIR